MAAFGDPKLGFYLEHKALIDEWAALRSLEIEAAHAAIGPVADAVADALRAGATDKVIVIDQHIDDDRRVVGLHRPGWTTWNEGPPRVMVAFCWYEEDATLSSHGDGTPPWVGIRVRKRAKEHRRIHRALAPRLVDSTELREVLPEDNKSDTWPRFRNVTIDGSPTQADLDALVDRATDLLRRGFDIAAPIVDEIIG